MCYVTYRTVLTVLRYGTPTPVRLRLIEYGTAGSGTVRGGVRRDQYNTATFSGFLFVPSNNLVR